MLLETGQVIDGKYRITRLIGTGGMGAVYEGENVLIRRRVAIKVLHADSATNTDVIRRFEREAQAAGEIGNDHILEVLDLGSLENGDRFMVMEYLDGETLAQRIERHGRLTPQQVAPIARQFLTALVSAHAAGIIHRDLKPENIFILRSKAGRADFVKLIDFGISKFSRPFQEGEHRMTRANAILGTPCYMSPEQARGAAETDIRSDIYSCGVILFESVTGRLPFEGDSFNDLMFKIALSDAPSPLIHVPSLDPDFAWIIGHAISRDPNARYSTAQAFAEALDEWMRKNSLTGTLALPQSSDAFPARLNVNKRAETLSLDDDVDSIGIGKTGSDESWARSKAETPTKHTRRKRSVLVAAASVAGVVALSVGFAALVRSDPPPAVLRGTGPAASSALPLPPAATARAAPGPTSASAAVAPAAGDTPQNLAPIATSSAPDPAPSPFASKRAPPRGGPTPVPHPSAQPTVASDKPKPKPPPVANGFDLGY